MSTLADLVSQLDERSTCARDALNRWFEAGPGAATIAALQHLGRSGSGPRERQLARFLAVHNAWTQYLLDTRRLTDAEAIAAAKTLSAVDMAFSAHLQAAAENCRSEEEINRAFQIIYAVGRAHLMVAWLQRMSQHADPYFQSKAALMLCRVTGNPLVIDRLLQSPDGRVRANAIEALWTVHTPAAMATLRHAVRDSHHRVAINALLGLRERGEKGITERMIAVANHRSADFRAAIAWAMGLTGDAAFRECLERLAGDASASVRTAAEMALKRLPPAAI